MDCSGASVLVSFQGASVFGNKHVGSTTWKLLTNIPPRHEPHQVTVTDVVPVDASPPNTHTRCLVRDLRRSRLDTVWGCPCVLQPWDREECCPECTCLTQSNRPTGSSVEHCSAGIVFTAAMLRPAVANGQSAFSSMSALVSYGLGNNLPAWKESPSDRWWHDSKSKLSSHI